MSPRPSKRAQILDAAIAVFDKDGYARATMDDIARKANVTKQTVYNNFGSKDELFNEATETVLGELNERLGKLFHAMPEEPADPELDLTELAVRWAKIFLTPSAAALRRLVMSEVRHHPELLKRWVTAGPGPIEAKVARMLDVWHRNGILQVEDAALAARQLRVLVTTEPWNRSMFGTRPLTTASIQDMVRPNVRLFLRAFSRR